MTIARRWRSALLIAATSAAVVSCVATRRSGATTQGPHGSSAPGAPPSELDEGDEGEDETASPQVARPPFTSATPHPSTPEPQAKSQINEPPPVVLHHQDEGTAEDNASPPASAASPASPPRSLSPPSPPTTLSSPSPSSLSGDAPPEAATLADSAAAAAGALEAAGAPPGSHTEARGRQSVWSFGLTGMRRSLKSGGNNEVLGNGAAVQIGTGFVSESWYVLATLDILLGPYEPTYGRQLDVDFIGTGATVWAGFSAQAANLRSPAGGYGFALGLSYGDSVGRSYGRNHLDSGTNQPADRQLPQNYVMEVNDLSLLPAVFFSWLAPSRPRGNTPELLKTRIEGYLLSLGAAIPISSTYAVKYDEPCQTDPTPCTVDDTSNRGSLRGYSILINLTALLGT